MYTLLRRQSLAPRQPIAFSPELLVPGDYALDLETTGLDPQTSSIVGIGLANAQHCFYVDLTNGEVPGLRDFLKKSRFTVFNLMFDGTHLLHHFGEWFNFYGCSYALFKQLAGEGFTGQSWSLEVAQLSLLGWDVSNKTALDTALKAAGLSKGELYKLPFETLSTYCASDADAAWQLWEYLSSVASEQSKDYHQRIFLPQVALLAEQQLRGIYVDQELLTTCHTELLEGISASMEAFLTHRDVAPHIAARNQEVLEAWRASEPPRLTAKGEVSKRWEAWRDREQTVLAKNGFNPNSKPQLADLFYHKLGYRCKKHTETGREVVDRKVLPALGDPGKLLAGYNLLVKRRGYVERVRERSARDGLIHPQMNAVGTVTLRPAGSGQLNLLQMPKVVDFLAALRARPGCKLVQLDCLHPKTELLTRRGWTPILEVLDTDEVWQVNKDTLIGRWCKPTKIIRKQYSGNLYIFGNRRGTLAVTENHRMLFGAQLKNNRAHKQSKRYVTLAKEGITASGRSLLTSSLSTDESHYSERDIWLACMLQADGSLTEYGKYRIEVSKPLKREFVASLLGRTGYVHPPREGQTLETESWYGIEFSSPLLKGKRLDLSTLGSNQAEVLIRAISAWDCTSDKGSWIYTNCDLSGIEEIQRYLVRCGYEARLYEANKASDTRRACYGLSIRKQKGIRLRPEFDVRTEHYDGLVGCVTVPEGFIQVRSEGQTFLTGNCEALEPTILAEFSQDETLLKIYGPDAKPNDIYLFLAAKIDALGGEIRKYYDPDNPTPEGIKKAKKLCKQDRNIAKTVHLASQYGAGAAKIHETLTLGGIDLSLNQVREIMVSYKALFRGTARFEEQLKDYWAANKGWIPSILGTPICVAEQYLKDIINRFCQFSASQFLQLFVFHVLRLADERGLSKYLRPWIANFYDETIFEVPEEHAVATAQILQDALSAANAELELSVPIKGSPMIADCLAEIKCGEDYQEWLTRKTLLKTVTSST